MLNCMIKFPCFAIGILGEKKENRGLGLDSSGGEVIGET